MDLAHLHLMLNHVPVFGVFFGFMILLTGIISRWKGVSGVGLALLVLSGLVAIPVYLTGESAEEIVEHLPGVTESIIGQHESSAATSLALAIASGALAAGALLFSRLRASPVNGALVVATLLFSLITGTSMMRTANLGGQVRHTEIRGSVGSLVPAGTDASTDNAAPAAKESKHDDDDD